MHYRRRYLNSSAAYRNKFKPANLTNLKTINEVAAEVGRDESRIRQLERAGKIPSPVRVRAGALRVRLYTPDEVAKIQSYFKNAKPGNPNLQKKD